MSPECNRTHPYKMDTQRRKHTDRKGGDDPTPGSGERQSQVGECSQPPEAARGKYGFSVRAFEGSVGIMRQYISVVLSPRKRIQCLTSPSNSEIS